MIYSSDQITTLDGLNYLRRSRKLTEEEVDTFLKLIIEKYPLLSDDKISEISDELNQISSKPVAYYYPLVQDIVQQFDLKSNELSSNNQLDLDNTLNSNDQPSTNQINSNQLDPARAFDNSDQLPVNPLDSNNLTNQLNQTQELTPTNKVNINSLKMGDNQFTLAKFNSISKRLEKIRIHQLNLSELNENKFNDWKIITESKLKIFGLVEFIKLKPSEELCKDNDFVYYDDIIKSHLIISVSDEFRREINACSTSFEAFSLLTNRFEGNDNIKCIRLFKEIMNIFNKNATLKDILVEFKKFNSNITKLFPTIDTKPFIGLLFAILPDKLSYLTAHLRCKDDLTLDQLLKYLSDESHIINEKLNQASNPNQLSKANFNISSSDKTAICNYCNKNGHLENKCYKKKRDKRNQINKSNTPNPSRSSNQPSQNSRNQPSKSKSIKSIGQLSTEDSQQVDDDSPTDQTVKNSKITIANYKLNAIFNVNHQNGVKSDKWYFDTGSECNMTNNLDHCTEITNTDHIFTCDAHGNKEKAVGIGKYRLPTPYGYLTLDEVIYSKHLEASYISGGVLDKLGYKWIGGDGKVKIMKDDSLICEGSQVSNTLYEMQFSDSTKSIMATRTDDIEQWHIKLGHLNPNYMNKFFKINRIPLNCPLDFRCYYCLISKCNRLPHKQSTIKSKSILELIHTDVSGIIRIKNPLGMRYWIVFIDDFTRMTFLYLMKRKSESFEKFLEFKNHIELQTKVKIKSIRSDNGTEYTDQRFNDFCIKSGIKHEFSIPHHPSSNGVSERKMRTLIESARSLLLSGNLSLKFWPFAIITSNYARNRSPCSSIKFEIPFSKFFNKPIQINDLVPFGQDVIFNDSPNTKTKFSSNGRRGIIVGYPTNQKGILVYSDGEIISSRDYYLAKDSVGLPDRDEESSLNNYEIEPAEQFIDYDLTDDLISNTNVKINSVLKFEETDDKIIIDVLDKTPNTIDLDPSPIEFYSKIILNKRVFNIKFSFTPSSYHEAIRSNEREHWLRAMLEEINQLESNDTWSLVELPQGKKLLRGMWCFKVKLNPDFTIERYKARWVAKGYTQTHGLDYDLTYSPVIRSETMNLIFSLSTHLKLKLYHLDVKNAYLNGPVEEQIYVQQPIGFQHCDYPNYVCKLNKSLYGLKQSARNWNIYLSELLIANNFSQMKSDLCLFKCNSPLMIVGVYVDDLIVACNKECDLQDLINNLNKKIQITNKGELSYFLGLNVFQMKNEIHINLQTYIQDLLKKTGMENCASVHTPLSASTDLDDEQSQPFANVTEYRRLLGSLLFISNRRPDLSFAVNRLCKYLANPKIVHYESAKRILRYLKGSTFLSLIFKSNKCDGSVITSYADSDYNNDPDQSKSISGNLTFVFGNLVSWSSKRQHFVATSTCEAELLSIRESISMIVYLKYLIDELSLGLNTENSTLMNDNYGAVTSLKDGGHFGRNKHYSLRINYIRDYCNKGFCTVKHVAGDQMIADLLTKQDTRFVFQKWIKSIPMINHQQSQATLQPK